MQTYLLIVYGVLSLVFFFLFLFRRKDTKTSRIIFAAYFCLMAASTSILGKDTEYIRALFSWLTLYLFISVLTYQFILPIRNRWVQAIGCLLFLALILSHLALNANKMRHAWYYYQCKRPDHGKLYTLTDWHAPYIQEQKVFYILFPERQAINDCYKK